MTDSNTITYNGTEYRVVEANGTLRAEEIKTPEGELGDHICELMGGAGIVSNGHVSGSGWHAYFDNITGADAYLCFHSLAALTTISENTLPDGWEITGIRPARGNEGIGVYFKHNGK